MIKKTLTIACLLFIAVSLTSCKNQQPSAVRDVLTKEQQDKLTPASVVTMLKEGNERFINGDLTIRDHNQQVRKSVAGQYPKAIILSCVDSRVPVEDVFDRGIGDLFVARVAGNFVNDDILGSMEFATKVAGSKAVVVLGHEHCGAVKAAVDNVQLGNITSLVKNIEPAVKKAKKGFKGEGEHTSKNPNFVHEVCERNIDHTIYQIKKRSEILRTMHENKEIAIVGAIYDMDTGKVTFMD